MAQLMPLPLTVSCSSKIQTGFTFLVPAHPGGPGQGAVKRVCVISEGAIAPPDRTLSVVSPALICIIQHDDASTHARRLLCLI